jgi:hypothetical protein
MLVICEANIPDLLPDNFAYYIENWASCAKALNPMIDTIVLLNDVQGFGTGKQIANVPWPLSKRITFTARYPTINFRENEHVLFMSERGVEELI